MFDPTALAAPAARTSAAANGPQGVSDTSLPDSTAWVVDAAGAVALDAQSPRATVAITPTAADVTQGVAQTSLPDSAVSTVGTVGAVVSDAQSPLAAAVNTRTAVVTQGVPETSLPDGGLRRSAPPVLWCLPRSCRWPRPWRLKSRHRPHLRRRRPMSYWHRPLQYHQGSRLGGTRPRCPGRAIAQSAGCSLIGQPSRSKGSNATTTSLPTIC